MSIEKKPEVNDIVLSKWQNILDFVANLFGVESSRITKINNTDIETILSSKIKHNVFGDVISKDDSGYCNKVVEKKSTLVVEGSGQSYLGIPIMWPDQEIFGTLVIEDVGERKFSQTCLSIMSSFEKIMNTDLALLMQNQSYDKK